MMFKLLSLKIDQIYSLIFSRIENLPYILNISIIESCNARCVMCDIWKSNDGTNISSSDLKYLANNQYKYVRHIGLSGGEPFLRKDLIEYVTNVLTFSPKLKSLSITSHAFQTARLKKYLPEIKKTCDAFDVNFSMNFSLDGDSYHHERNRGLVGGYDKVIYGTKLCKSLGIKVNLQFTATEHNVYSMPWVLSFANTHEIPVSFRLATNINRLGVGNTSRIRLSEKQLSFFKDFISSKKLLSNTKLGKRIFYKLLFQQLEDPYLKRLNSCLFKKQGLFISGLGSSYTCSLSDTKLQNSVSKDLFSKAKLKKLQKKLISNNCNDCVHDQSGLPSLIRLIKESFLIRFPFIKKIGFLIKLSSGFYSSSPSAIPHKTLVIGQYGGEHVGDSAILGGVLSSINSNSTDVLSIRPFRTQMWIDGIIKDEKTRAVSIEEAFKNINLYSRIIYGGGPIMDLPSILLYQYLILLKKSKETSFHIYGAGILNFKNKFSKFLLRQILKKAESINLRSNKSVELLSDLGFSGKFVTDPAISFIKDNFKNEYKANDKKLLINLRPLWTKYTNSYSKNELMHLEEKILKDVSKLILDLEKNHGFQVDFVPFNHDQFGMSDTDLAIKLKNMLPNHSSFKIIYEEYLFEEMLKKVSNYKYAICMRLHAAVFCNEVGVKTVGIDYSDEYGKVAQYFSEVDKADCCFNLNTFDINKIKESLLK